MLAFIGIIITMFSIMSMQLALVSVMPVISAELGGASLYSWVFSGYMIASLVTIPLFSKLADVYGRRRFYLASICIFVAGSLIGAVSASMMQLIAARLVQGAAAGVLAPVSLAMVSEMFPPARRGKMIGYFSLVQLAANILSPIIGEVVTKYLNWHWVFYLSILMLTVSLLISCLAGKPPERGGAARPAELDITGGILFGALSALVVYFFNGLQAGVVFDLRFAVQAGTIVIAAACLVFVEKRAKQPVIRADFFRATVLRRSIISAVISGAVMYGFVNLIPILTEIAAPVMGINTSMLLLTFMIGITIGMLIGSRLWVSFKKLPLALWLVMTAAVLGVTLCLNFELYWPLVGANVVSGAALGGIMSTVLIYSQNSVSDADRTVLSGIVQLGRYFGAAVGVAVMIALLPDLDVIQSLPEFSGAFTAILGLCVLGVCNERIGRTDRSAPAETA